MDLDWLPAFLDAERLPKSYAHTVETVALPLADQIVAAGAPATIGVCGTQASGKSTLVAVVARLLERRGLSVAILSIDDLYLTRPERETLAARVHPLFVTRGPPGTHDVALGLEVLDSLRRPGLTALPRFDKAQDTRKPREAWDVVEGPVDVVLFEGWCVGARPQSSADLQAPVNALERDLDPDGVWRRYANDALAGPYQTLFGRLDQLVLLAAPSFDVVLAWRMEQERKLRERLARDGGDLTRSLSDEAVANFIAHYERLTRHILTEMPGRADAVVPLDAQRRALSNLRNSR
jgi:D-glycerate 3-kinase